ncbi:MAG: hypothetical protein ACLGIA_03660 [Actinomycetes bacterium]
MNHMSGRRRAGFVLGMILGLSNLVSIVGPSGEAESGAPAGPPMAVIVVDMVCGVLVIALLALAWRTGRRSLVRAAAVLMILAALSAVPAFFAGVPAPVQILAAAYILATLVSVVLMFAPVREPAPLPVLD